MWTQPVILVISSPETMVGKGDAPPAPQAARNPALLPSLVGQTSSVRSYRTELRTPREHSGNWCAASAKRTFEKALSFARTKTISFSIFPAIAEETAVTLARTPCEGP